MKVPEWTDFIKTGKFKELSPYDPDWYFIRAGIQALACSNSYDKQRVMGLKEKYNYNTQFVCA